MCGQNDRIADLLLRSPSRVTLRAKVLHALRVVRMQELLTEDQPSTLNAYVVFSCGSALAGLKTFNSVIVFVWRLDYFRRVCKIEKSFSMSVVQSVRPSVLNNSAATGQSFMKFDI
jgi:hypothetical protein